MASTYTVNLGIEKIGTGEQSGTWGTTTNTNFDLIDQAINGAVTVTLASAGTSGSPNTLAITNGAASDGRNKFIDFNDGGDLGATAYVQLDPNDAEKIVHMRNSLSGGRSVIVFQGTYNASNDFEIPNGKDVVLKFDGAGASATVTDVFTDLQATAITTPNLTATTADINGGNIDGTVIGAATPAAGSFTTGQFGTSLNVDGTVTADGLTVETASDPAQITLRHTGNTSGLVIKNFSGAEAQLVNVDNGPMVFKTNDNEAMRITSAGNVGIGTTSPTYKLDVQGGSSRFQYNAANQTAGEFYNTNATGYGVFIQGGGAASRYALNVTDYAGTSILYAGNSNNVGIGTTSPITNFTLGSGTTGVSFQSASSTFNSGKIAVIKPVEVGSGNGHLVFETYGGGAGGGERMRITSAGNVTIGSTDAGNAGTLNLSVGLAGTTTGGVQLWSPTNGTHYVQFGDSTTGGDPYRGAVGYNHTDDALLMLAAGSERARIDSSGNLLVETTASGFNGQGLPLVVGSGSGNTGMTIYSGAAGYGTIQFADAETTGAGSYAGVVSYNHASGFMYFSTNAAERMRIDSSGNLLVGTTQTPATLITTSTTSHAGVGIADGYLSIARDLTGSAGSGGLAFFNRLATDGPIADFRKDGTTVGSIGTASSKLTIGSGATGVRFNYASLDTIAPWNVTTNAVTDGATDLGYTNARFKDLYLSGGVYLGGTAAANHLDDYEEGTWTPALGGSTTSGSFTYSYQEGYYVKVGNKVTISFSVALSAIATGGGGFLRITGSPWSTSGSAGAPYSRGSIDCANVNFNGSANALTVLPRSSASSELVINEVTSGGGLVNVGASDLTATSVISGQITLLLIS